MKGKKKPSLTVAKNKAWAAFSQYIRLRYADPHTGMVTCVTCGKTAHWKEMQAGHFLDGRRSGTIFDERGANVQCVKCNMFNSGAKVEYFIWMESTHGREVIDELRQNDKKSIKRTAADYAEIEREYKKKVAELGAVDAF